MSKKKKQPPSLPAIPVRLRNWDLLLSAEPSTGKPNFVGRGRVFPPNLKNTPFPPTPARTAGARRSSSLQTELSTLLSFTLRVSLEPGILETLLLENCHLFYIN